MCRWLGLLNYSLSCEKRRGSRTVTRSERETCTHSSEFGPIHEPKRFDYYRCLRYGRLARINERFLFRIKGVTQRYRKIRPSYTQNIDAQLQFSWRGHRRAATIKAIVWEIKSIRFPRVFALLPRRDYKIRYHRHADSPFHSTWLYQLVKFLRWDTKMRWAKTYVYRRPEM